MSKEDRKLLLKMIVIGNSGVGKTAILHQYVNNTFIEEHKATIGADFLTKEIRISNKDITVQIWDTAGQERFLSLGTAFYRGADACVLVYDVTNKESFDKIEEWRSNFLEHCDPNDPDEFPFILVGNKIDKSSERQVETNDGKSKADKLNMNFFETSALNGNGIERAMKDLISTASESDSVPFFTKDVQVKIEREQDGEEPETPQQPCPCSLL